MVVYIFEDKDDSIIEKKVTLFRHTEQERRVVAKLRPDEQFCSNCSNIKNKKYFNKMTKEQTIGTSPQFYCKECQAIVSKNPKKLVFERYEEGDYMFTTAKIIPTDKDIE